MPKQPFIPPLLPPKIDYSFLLTKIVAARDAISRYDEAVKRLPNPEIIQRSIRTKEAVLSSRIEGTQVTLDEVFLLDAQEEIDEHTQKRMDYREVFNYRRAIFEGKRVLKEKPLTENVIKKLHKILLGSARGKNKALGEFRKDQVYIGKPGGGIEQATFVPAPPQEIINLFSNLEKFLHLEKDIDPVVQIAIAHYQFEAIHPFSDGNGRVGRLIVPLFLYEKKITAYPNIFVSEFLEENREEYYQRLKEVSEQNKWKEWISFFLDAVIEQTKKTHLLVTKIEQLHQELHDMSPSFNSIYASAFIDAIFQSPHFKVKQIKKISGIKNNQTLYSLIEKFTGAGILVDLFPKISRNKIYAFKDLTKIIR
jgi:Fic family protein